MNSRPERVRPRRRRWSVAAALAALLLPLFAAAPAPAQTVATDVDRLYCAYFLREPDADGRAYWHDVRADGASLEDIADQFALSDEFRLTYGGDVSTEAFVRLIYRNLFDREPDAAGLEYWTEVLDTGRSPRGTVMTYFSVSDEFLQRLDRLGCGGTGGTGNPQVAARFGALTGWETPVLESVDDRDLDVVSSAPRLESGSRITTTCRPAGLAPISRTFTDFPAYAFDGPTLPGLIVEGQGIPEGDLRVLPLERRPINLVSTLDSEVNVRRVVAPTTSTVQSAVTALKRNADIRIGEDRADVVPTDITYIRHEVHSFEEASLRAGVSLHYANETTTAGFDLDRAQNDAVERHSIVVRFVQPMFTIAMERDGITAPADHFAGSVTMDDIDRLTAQGRLSATNPPVLIDSVTYGRIMMFTMTSETATSAEELRIAVNATHGGISGQADLTTRQRSLLQTSDIQMLAYGGDQGLALSSIRNGDLASFFGPANTTTAAPLTMSLRTLDGSQIDVGDDATLQQIVCTDQATPFEFRVAITELAHADANIRINDRLLTSASHGETRTLTVPNSWLRNGTNTITFELRLGTCAWLLDNEVLGAAVWSRGSGSDPWGGPSWTERFDGTACYFDWNVTVDTRTGGVSGP